MYCNCMLGITLQLPGGFGTLTIDGKVYKVINVHFHQPAEHTINVFIRFLLFFSIQRIIPVVDLDKYVGILT